MYIREEDLRCWNFQTEFASPVSRLGRSILSHETQGADWGNPTHYG